MEHVTILGVTGMMSVIVILVLAAVLVFEITMFISVIRNTHIPDNTRILWIIGMLLFHPFIAIAYYFTDYTKTK